MKTKDLIDALRDDWARERPELDTSGMAVVGRLVLLGELLKKRITRELKAFDIGYTDLDVLATLRRSGAPYALRPADLLERVLIQSGSLTACLDRLERNGLVVRVPSPTDRRSLSVQLAPEGHSLVDRAIERRFADAVDCIAALSKADVSQLATHLRTLVLDQLDEGVT